jgi:hypothetical protein
VLEHPGAWLPAEPDSLYQAVLPNKQAARPITLRLTVNAWFFLRHNPSGQNMRKHRAWASWKSYGARPTKTK